MKNLSRHPIKKLLAVVTFVGATSSAAIAAPRTLANGAPAPGNTVAKGYRQEPASLTRKMERARAALVAAITEEKLAKQQLIASPRTLPNGAPACGNTGGKAPPCTADIANELHEQRIARVREAEKAVKLARARLHEATRKVAMQKRGGGSRAIVAADDDVS
ncbi:MAG: hypothetical protein AB7T06_16580 [Kofleriaceae bacterium]